MEVKIDTKFITDKNGDRKAVVMDMKDYENLMEFIDDLEDAYELFKAEREARKFIPYDAFREKLKKEGRI